MNSTDAAVPTRWADLALGSVKVALVAFVVLQLKEYYDAGMFDTVAVTVDAVLIAAGTFALNAILKMVKPA
jgi:dolichyl-phosphate-mannose--protein O-mannosyl transferase